MHIKENNNKYFISLNLQINYLILTTTTSCAWLRRIINTLSIVPGSGTQPRLPGSIPLTCFAAIPSRPGKVTKTMLIAHSNLIYRSSRHFLCRWRLTASHVGTYLTLYKIFKVHDESVMPSIQKLLV